jgi:hypothetical protein
MLEKASHLLFLGEQFVEASPQVGIVAAGPIQIRGSLRAGRLLDCASKDLSFVHGRIPHSKLSIL